MKSKNALPYRILKSIISCLVLLGAFNSSYGQVNVTAFQDCGSGCPDGYTCHQVLRKCIPIQVRPEDVPCSFDQAISDLAKRHGGPVTYGLGFSASFAVSGNYENGVAYKEDGRTFACYDTYCGGIGTSAGFETYVVWGFYNPGTWDQLKGNSTSLSFSVGVGVPNLDLGVSGQVATVINGSGQAIGVIVGYAISAGVSALPVGDANVSSCETLISVFDKSIYDKKGPVRNLIAATHWPSDLDRKYLRTTGGLVPKTEYSYPTAERSKKIVFWGRNRLGQIEMVEFDPNSRRKTKDPELVTDLWPSPGDVSLNAVLSHEQEVYFIYLDKFYQYHVGASRGKTVAGINGDDTRNYIVNREPKRLRDEFGGWPSSFSNINAAVLVPNTDKAYFFKGDKVIRVDMRTKMVDRSKRSLDRMFTDWPEGFSRIDAAVANPKEKLIYFFANGQYIAWNYSTKGFKFERPRLLYNTWKKLMIPPVISNAAFPVKVKSTSNRAKDFFTRHYMWSAKVLFERKDKSQPDELPLMLIKDQVENKSLAKRKVNNWGETYRKRAEFTDEHTGYFKVLGKASMVFLPNHGSTKRHIEFEKPMESRWYHITELQNTTNPIDVVLEGIYGDQPNEKRKHFPGYRETFKIVVELSPTTSPTGGPNFQVRDREISDVNTTRVQARKLTEANDMIGNWRLVDCNMKVYRHGKKLLDENPKFNGSIQFNHGGRGVSDFSIEFDDQKLGRKGDFTWREKGGIITKQYNNGIEKLHKVQGDQRTKVLQYVEFDEADQLDIRINLTLRKS